MQLRRLVLLACVLLTACAVTIRKQDVAAYGTKQFALPKEKVFAASLGALKSMGYPITVENPERGLIKTGRVLVHLYSAESSMPALDMGAAGSTLTMSTAEFRQYSVEIVPVADGTVEARVTPHLFHGDSDVSEQSVWSLSDEKTHWAEFFRAVDEAL